MSLCLLNDSKIDSKKSIKKIETKSTVQLQGSGGRGTSRVVTQREHRPAILVGGDRHRSTVEESTSAGTTMSPKEI
jgi:hypothetical protein